MSGRILGSSLSNAIRTVTVAFWRSAAGIVVMTCAGIVQSRYASSTASTFCPGVTRSMYASLTSTSISSDDMSTIVEMPVLVKPPPADIGEIISPGCAFFEIATPANGARISMSARFCLSRSTDRSAARTCSTCAAWRASSTPTSASTESQSDCAAIPLARRSRMRCLRIVASLSCAAISTVTRCAAASCASASARLCAVWRSSRRARTCPFSTFIPSSTSTSTTFPVTFDDTVASRRAVTYPDAFRTVEPPPDRWAISSTAAVRTSSGRGRRTHHADTAATASTTTPTTTAVPVPRRGRSAWSIFSAASFRSNSLFSDPVFPNRRIVAKDRPDDKRLRFPDRRSRWFSSWRGLRKPLLTEVLPFCTSR